MKIVDQGYEINRWDPSTDMREICQGARLCYKSNPLDDYEQMDKFIRSLIRRGHHTPLEHSILSVTFTTNRAITHELVRHRVASINQESTRYCNYGNDRFEHNVYFIRDTSIPEEYLNDWYEDCLLCEKRYFERLEKGYTPNEARGVLNNDVKAEIKITANYREWRHIFKLRCDSVHAHRQMVELMTPLLEEVTKVLPCVFDDIKY